MTTATQNCEMLETCPIFQHFKRYAKKIYIEQYCQGNYENCERYKLRQAGKPVPENLLPHGCTLWEEG